MSNQFNFRYTAPSQEERKEIDSIRRQYAPQEKTETKLERLRRLDGLVKNTAIIWSLVLGVVGVLILGFGMSLAISDLREILGSHRDMSMVYGIVIGFIGIVPMAIAYPVYKSVLNKGKAKYGDEILRLSEELLNESEK